MPNLDLLLGLEFISSLLKAETESGTSGVSMLYLSDSFLAKVLSFLLYRETGFIVSESCLKDRVTKSLESFVSGAETMPLKDMSLVPTVLDQSLGFGDLS